MTFNSYKLVIIFLFLSACQYSHRNKWELVWEDNFNGEINEDVWSKIPRGKPDWQNYMSDYDSCYAIKDGNLLLRGIKNDVLPDDTAQFLTGGLYTKDKKSFENGKIEIRARFENARGAWPAFWLLPFTDKYGGWPDGGEIDIMERLNGESIAYQTVHSHYTHTLRETQNPIQGITFPIDRNGYNNYAVELYPDSLVFSINGKHTFTYPRILTNKPGQFPFDQSFYLLLDMQLGGSWVGKVYEEDLPVTMYIDWVKFYRKK